MIHARRHESGISPSRVRRSVRLYRVSTSSLLVHFLTTSSLSLPPPAITSRPSSFFVFYFAIHPSFLPPSDARSLARSLFAPRAFGLSSSESLETKRRGSPRHPPLSFLLLLSTFFSSSFSTSFSFCSYASLFSPCPRVLYPTHAMLFHAWPTTRNRGAIEITYT